MDPTVVLSAVGMAFTISAANSHAFKLQELEGTKVCDNQTIRVLYRDDKVYLRTAQKVYTMAAVPTNRGVNNVKRFETRDRTITFMQLPEKAMILDNAKMTPISNDCLNV